ncbi:lipoprotein YteS [Bacillus haynesii]|uniref:lipoprotein YteS n=1 Tax=Bacillus haynesii TaxID=1925021 RepID=UPI00227EB485|nr:lipoprotein YteS [Bacillus haynesii]MCY7863426.1 lipoprotein YteS [Bacillus haynesii]MCY8047746.1 lipoprotein YteS [Bacillus haynesii]MCY8069082.1 lipoprotein YteS [Bacillus haynesii]MCY8079266.1 lipoprotein YteS [Bacillus haynesii]MCY8341683.1 lipoprotein YteS [Bacillus haynesii]
MKNFAFSVLLFAAVLLLSSCGKDGSRGTDVLIFSDAPAEIKENVQRAAEKEQLNIIVFPAAPEKLLVEIAAKEGDLFIVPEDMFKPFYDPEGLQPLNVPSEEKEPYSAPGKNGEVQLYAAVIGKGEKRLNGYTFQLNTDMAAFIPVYAKKTPEATELIEALRSK